MSNKFETFSKCHVSIRSCVLFINYLAFLLRFQVFLRRLIVFGVDRRRRRTDVTSQQNNIGTWRGCITKQMQRNRRRHRCHQRQHHHRQHYRQRHKPQHANLRHKTQNTNTFFLLASKCQKTFEQCHHSQPRLLINQLHPSLLYY